MIIESWDVKKLIPYGKNPRNHDGAVERMASVLDEYGFRYPILAKSSGEVIDGHLRLKAAIIRGYESVPVAIADDMSDEQIRAFRIAVNKSATFADFDIPLLIDELKNCDGFFTGFTDSEIESFFDGNKNLNMESLKTVDGNITENSDSICKIGDIWELGNNILVCGDSTNQSIVAYVNNSIKSDTVVYDPPYDVNELWSYCPKNEKRIVMFDYKRTLQAIKCVDDMEFQYHFVWDGQTSWYTPNRPLARHKSAIVGLNNPYWNFEEAIFHDGKSREKKKIKNTRGEHEYSPLKDGFVHLSTVFSKNNAQETDKHGHGKPVNWVYALIRGCNSTGCIDMFGGSGATLMACEIAAIPCASIEIEPGNCDLIIQRWEETTGLKADKSLNSIGI